MSSHTSWFRKSHPNRSELLAVIAALAIITENIVSSEPIPVVWALVGFVGTVIVLGPVADSESGTRLGDQFPVIGVNGRIAVLVGLGVLLWVNATLLGRPGSEVNAIAVGSLSAVVVYAFVETVVTWAA